MGRRDAETQSVSTRGVVETQSVSTRGVVETQSARQRMLKCAIAVYMPLDRTEAMEISGVTSGPRRKEQRRPHPSPGCCAVVSCNPNLSLTDPSQPGRAVPKRAARERNPNLSLTDPSQQVRAATAEGRGSDGASVHALRRRNLVRGMTSNSGTDPNPD